MRKTLILLSLLTLILPCAYGERNQIAVEHRMEIASATPERISATVKRVMDGNTILVTLKDGKEERVRLLYVDAEESVHPDKSKNTKFGELTAEAVKYMLPSGKKVDLEFEGKKQRDKYSRLLAHVFTTVRIEVVKLNDDDEKYIGKEDLRVHVNEFLIRYGYSPYYTKYGRSKKYDTVFRESEDIARSYKCGIWARGESVLTNGQVSLRLEGVTDYDNGPVAEIRVTKSLGKGHAVGILFTVKQGDLIGGPSFIRTVLVAHDTGRGIERKHELVDFSTEYTLKEIVLRPDKTGKIIIEDSKGNVNEFSSGTPVVIEEKKQ